MDYLSVFCIVLGVLVVVTRAPFVVSPLGSLNAFRKIFATPFRLRIMGVILGGFAAAIAWLPLGEGLLPLLGWAYGWVVIFAAVGCLFFPQRAQDVVFVVYDCVEEVLKAAGLRVAGALGVAVGAGLIYLGLYVV